MKKILIATTALVATAGVAAADVNLSGYARFGAVYDDASEDFNVASRLRLQFDATTQTDGGLTLGARIRMQSEEDGAGTRADGGNWSTARFFGSYGGVTVAMGNILGVIEAAPNLYLPTKSAGMGLEGNGFSALAANTVSNGAVFGWTAFQSAGSLNSTFGAANNGVEILYSGNGIGLHAHSTEDSFGLGANYSFGDYVIAAAYEEFDCGAEILFVSACGKWGAFDAALSYADTKNNAGLSAEKWSLRGGYTVNDALYVYGFVADENNGISEVYGLGASYALGGGASIEAGWSQNRDAANDSTNLVSAGIFFSF